MRSYLLAVAALAFLVGCGGSSAVVIDGVYSVNEQITSTNCQGFSAGQTSSDTITVTTSGNEATLSITSYTGTCSGPLDGDALTLSCTLSNSGETVTLQVAASFTSGHISGSFVIGAASCQISETFNGTKN